MNLRHKRLGSTDLDVSVLGLGTVKFGRNTDVKYPGAFNLPTDQEILNLLALAKDLNINMLDTAPSYGASEERLGKLLNKQRHDWVIVGKAGEEYIDQKSVYDFSRSKIIGSIERSLQHLKTDYIDVLLIHSDGNDEQIIEQNDVFATLQYAKQQGLIRYYGMSTKTVAGGIHAIENSDVAMVMCNPVYRDEIEVIEHAAKHNKGILIKKAFASGHLDRLGTEDPVQASMDYVLQQPGVSSIVLGTINPAHLKQNVECAIKAISAA